MLTKSDQVLALGWLTIRKLLNRVLGRSEDMRELGFSAAHFVFADHPALPAGRNLDEWEPEVYERAIHSQPHGMAAADMEVIQQRSTMQRLVQILVSRFEEFLSREGVPLALQWLDPKLSEASKRIRDLGRPVDKLSLHQVMQAVLDACDFQPVVNQLYEEQPGLPGLAILLPSSQTGQATLRTWEPSQQLQPPALAYYDELLLVAAAVLQGTRQWLNSMPHLALVEDMIRRAFASNGPLCLARFQSLLATILDGRLAHAIDMKEVEESILALPCLQRLRHGLPAISHQGALEAIDAEVRAAFIRWVIQPLREPNGPLAACVEQRFQLRESDSHMELRQRHNAAEQALKEAMGIMQPIMIKYPAAPAPPVAEAQAEVSELGAGACIATGTRVTHHVQSPLLWALRHFLAAVHPIQALSCLAGQCKAHAHGSVSRWDIQDAHSRTGSSSFCPQSCCMI